MARRYRKKAKRSKAKPSLISMIPLAYVAGNAINAYHQTPTDMGQMLRNTIGNTTGLDLQGQYPFNAGVAMRGVGILVGTYAAKKLVSYSGGNKAMKGLPFRL